MQLGKKRNHHVNLTLRLGKQTYGDAHYNLDLGREWNLTTGYLIPITILTSMRKRTDIRHQLQSSFRRSRIHQKLEKRTSQIGRNLPTLQLRLLPLSLRGQLADRYHQRKLPEVRHAICRQYIGRYLFPKKRSRIRCGILLCHTIKREQSLPHSGNTLERRILFQLTLTLMPRIEGRYLRQKTPLPK